MSHRDDTLQGALEQHLEALKENEDRDDWIRDLLEWLLQELLDLEFDQHLGADRYERTQDRRGYRHGPGHQTCGNGYYARDLFTRVGRLTLRVPRDRQGKFSMEFFERYQRSEKALAPYRHGVLALQESYLPKVRGTRAGRLDPQGQEDHRAAVRSAV